MLKKHAVLTSFCIPPDVRLTPSSLSLFPSRIPPSLSSSMISFRCPTALAGHGMNTTAAAMSAPPTSLSSNRKRCAWSSLSTSGICRPPLPRLPWLAGMDLKDLRVQWERPEHLEHLDRGTGLLLFFHPLRPHLQLPLHTPSPPSLHPQVPVRHRPRVPVTDHPTPATGVPQWAKTPASLSQTHSLQARGTGWDPSPAPWGLAAGWTEEAALPVQQNQPVLPSSSQ